MTYDELIACQEHTPVKLRDGAYGLLIRWHATRAGIQVPGEQAIRWVPLADLVRHSSGTLDQREGKPHGPQTD